MRHTEQTYPILFVRGDILGYIEATGSMVEKLETIRKDAVIV